MTEDEAKTKSCHKTIGPVASADGSTPWFSPQVCLGSACMAWRWDDVPNPNYRPIQVWPSDQLGTNPSYLKSTTDGHCGLAGRP